MSDIGHALIQSLFLWNSSFLQYYDAFRALGSVFFFSEGVIFNFFSGGGGGVTILTKKYFFTYNNIYHKKTWTNVQKSLFVFLPIPRNTKKEKQNSKSKLGPPPKEDDLVHKYRRLINLIFASQMFLVLEIIFFLRNLLFF